MHRRLALAAAGSLASLAVFVVPPAPAAADDPDPDALLARAQALYDDLEYDQVPPLTEALLAIEGLDIAVRLEAYRLQAQALAIVSDPIDAEAPFRLLLRARPDFDLPPDTPPRILAVFRKVQAEERAIVEQVEALRRKRLIENLELLGDPPERARGGRPIVFAFRLRDPTAAVQYVDVPYRRAGQTSYSVLALDRDREGYWRGAVTGEWTASADGFDLEYYVVTRDADGPLLMRGSELDPLRIAVAPGALEREVFRPIPRWAWWSGAAGTGVLAAAAGGFGLAAASAQRDHARYVASGLEGPIDGAILMEKERQGRMLATATNTALVSAGVAALLTLASTPFVSRATEP